MTTEIDLSWGEDIVHQLVAEMREHPEIDMVVASPHLPGGGYKNVPAKRVWLSRVGNHIIRACMTNAATMNTGMTRAYRREVIQSLPLFADGKEFHLEVMLKATEFGLHIREIPALLEWKDYKHQGRRVKRKSSSRVNQVIVSHSLFSVFANPVRYVWAASLASFALGAIFFVNAVVLYCVAYGVGVHGAVEYGAVHRGDRALRAGRSGQAGQHDPARVVDHPALPPGAREGSETGGGGREAADGSPRLRCAGLR